MVGNPPGAFNLNTLAAAPAAPRSVGTHRVGVVFSGLMLVMLLAALDSTIVATALPTIVGDLGGLERLSWVTSAYLLAQTAVTPLYGKLGDQLGRKRILQSAIVLFLVGSGLCGIAGLDDGADPLPRRAGTRRRRADRARAVDRRGHRLPARARPLPGAVRSGLRSRERRGPAAWRCDRRAPLLALDLLRQPADRDHRAVGDLGHPAGCRRSLQTGDRLPRGGPPGGRPQRDRARGESRRNDVGVGLLADRSRRSRGACAAGDLPRRRAPSRGARPADRGPAR